MSRRDFIILLSLAVLVLAFVAFEIAGLTLPGFHTVSWYAQASPLLDYLIIALFLLGGLAGAIWFWFHIRRGIPR